MLSLICAASLVIVGQPGPAEVHSAALGDLVLRVAPERQLDTRYVSLHSAAPGVERDTLYRSLIFSLNSTSFRSTLSQPPRVYGGVLVRVSLASLGWDVAARSARIARLASQGIDVSSFKADLWEEIVTGKEPYFFTNYYAPDGHVDRGWVDPKHDEQLRNLTYSSKAIVRADWLIARLLREKEDGGVYSQALLHPPTERDLYRGYGVNEKLLDADPTLRQGGAVLDSIVALHNRELQFIRTVYGWDEAVLARTFDVIQDAVGDKSVIESLKGTLKLDGREIIGTLPNGLHWGYLANGKGEQVNVVPQAIAIDQTQGIGTIKDRSVVNFYTCVRCHGPAGGYQPFDDVVGKVMLKVDTPRIGFVTLAGSKGRVEQINAELEDYYLTDLQTKIKRLNASYTARLKACNGLDPATNAQAINQVVEGYLYDLVTTEQGARETGQSLEVFKIMCRTSGNPHANMVAAGIPVRRPAWESAFADVQRANVWPWEGKH